MRLRRPKTHIVIHRHEEGAVIRAYGPFTEAGAYRVGRRVEARDALRRAAQTAPQGQTTAVLKLEEPPR